MGQAAGYDPNDRSTWVWDDGVGGRFAMSLEAYDRSVKEGRPLWQTPGVKAELAERTLSNSPGGTLDTAQPDEERARMGQFLGQLQGQAQTGEGAWAQTLKNSTRDANASAMALGQSMPGANRMTELRDIQNTQGANDQRAVGQANILRAQSQMAGTENLGNALNSQGELDANQAAASSAASQGVREATDAALDKQGKQWLDTVSKAGQAVAMLASKGGTVPGEAKIFGDDEANDTVPAWLSPGEIVIPRHVTKSSDAPGRAAAFVRAVQEKHKAPQWASPQHLAEGGPAYPTLDNGTNQLVGGVFEDAQVMNDPSVTSGTNTFGAPQQAASIRNGGLFDRRPYNETRAATLNNADKFLAQAQGAGPSVAPQQMQNATDSNLAEAMQAMANARGAGAAASRGEAVGREGAAQQDAAGKAASTVASEQDKGEQAFAKAILAQRARDLAFAQARQQAAWRNTMMNTGIGAEQQAQMRNILGGAAQGAAGVSGMLSDNLFKGDNEFNSDVGGTKLGSESDFGGSADQWASYPGSSGAGDFNAPDIDSGGYAAKGGMVRGYDDGGEVTELFPSLTAPRRSEYVTDFEGRNAEREAQMLADIQAGSKASPTEDGAAPFSLQSFAPGMPGGLGHRGPIQGESRNPFNPAAKALSRVPGLALKSQSPTAEKSPEPIAAPPDKPAASASPASPAWSAPVDRSPGEAAQAIKDEQSAAAAKGSAEAELARNQAAAYSEQEKMLQRHALEQKEMQDRAHASAQDAMSKVQQARDEMAKIDTSVDPGRWWATRSTGGKIAGIIGLALGAIGAGNDGINRAAGMIQQNIDRDIDAQKAEHELRLKKGQGAVDSAQSMYAMNHAALQDDLAAQSATKASALELADNKLKQIAATAQSPIAKANAQQLSAQLQLKKAEFDAQASSRLTEAKYKGQLLDLEKQKVALDATKVAAVKTSPTGGIEAIDRFEKQWQRGGGFVGKISKHIPGTEANDLENISTADAAAIATQLNGGKAPRPAFIEMVKTQMLPQPGESVKDGQQKLRELRRVLQNSATRPGPEEAEVE